MAEVTVDSKDKRLVSVGHLKAVTAQVDIAANGDTFDTGLHDIVFWTARDDGTSAVGGTDSGGTITFAVGGALTNVTVFALGFG